MITRTSTLRSQAVGVTTKPAEPFDTIKYESFAGGHFSGAKQTNVPDNAAKDSLDVYVNRNDRVVRAPGTTGIESLFGHVPKQAVLHPSLNYTSELVILCEAEFGAKREDVTVWHAAPLPAGRRFATTVYGDVLLATNGRAGIYARQPKGITFPRVDGLPTGATLAVVAGRLFIGGAEIGGNFQPMGQFWTGSENYDDIDELNGAGSEVLFASNAANDRVVANRAMSLDFMAILCRSSIWIGKVSGDPTRPLDFQPRVSGKGCIAEPTAQTVHGGVIYLSDEGVEFFDGNDSVGISDPISPDLLPLDIDLIDSYHSMYNPFRRWYYLFTPTTTFIFDLVRRRWAKLGMIATGASLFATQFHETTWAEMIGTWGQQTKTWAEFSPREAEGVDTYFLGTRAGNPSLDIEDAASWNYFGVQQTPFWLTKTNEGQLPSNTLFTAKAVRMEYQGAGSVEIQINEGKPLGQYVLPNAAVPSVRELAGNQSARGVALKFILLSGSPEIVKLELDVKKRSKFRQTASSSYLAPVKTAGGYWVFLSDVTSPTSAIYESTVAPGYLVFDPATGVGKTTTRLPTGELTFT